MKTAVAPASSRYRPTGARTGITGFTALALLRHGHSINQVSKTTGLARETIAALSERFLVGFQHVDTIRTSVRDLALLLGSEILWSIDPAQIHKMSVRDRVDAACKLLDKCVSPEQAGPGPLTFIQHNYGLTPSHSASQPTIEASVKPGTPQPVAGEQVEAGESMETAQDIAELRQSDSVGLTESHAEQPREGGHPPPVAPRRKRG